MVVLGSLIGGLGAIATHRFLDNAAVDQSPTFSANPVPSTPSAENLPETPSAPSNLSAAPAVIPPEPAALASFSPMALANNNQAEVSNDPLGQLWTQPAAWAQRQSERVDMAYKVQSGAIPQQFRGQIIRGGGVTANNKVIALTFDDGPWHQTTEAAMNLLKQYGGKGTFFVVGNLVGRYPDLVKRMVAEGHEVANHTWSHRLAYSSPAVAAREIDSASAAIAKYTGFSTRIYRPPGGILNNGLVNYARSKGYAILMWSTDTMDWRSRQPEAIRQRVLRSLKPGAIVLMHDGGGPRWATISALSKLLPELQAKGYRFVTVSELLWIREQERRQAEQASQTVAATKAP